MKALRSIASFAAVFLLSAAPALAETFFYEGSPYTTNGDPTDFGDRMTGSVSFSCNPCADGSYDQNSAVITSFQLRSGIFVNTLSQYGLVEFLVRSNAIIEWQAFPVTGPALASVGSTDPTILANFQAHAGPPPSTGVGDVVRAGPTGPSAVTHTSGNWSAPLSDMGSGLSAFVTGFAILFFWRRAKKAVSTQG
jgi:hypothetical protein